MRAAAKEAETLAAAADVGYSSSGVLDSIL